MTSKLFVLSFFTIIVATILVCIGSADIGLKDIFALFNGDLCQTKKVILLEIRIPRVIMAFLIGMLLASSGLVTQSVFLNPLADPYIIGIASAATFGAVVAYFLKLPDIYYAIFAFICSAVLSFVIFNLYKKAKNLATLLIIGIAFSSFLGAFTSFATYLIGEESFKIVAWMMGYLGSASWSKIYMIILPLIITFIYFYSKKYELNVMLSGDEEAKSLGVNVEKVKKRLLIISSLAVSFSVAFAGMIGFVGLIIPHTLRMLLRSSNNAVLIPMSGVVGGLFLLICDGVGKSILAPTEIPIGVVTAFFGAPFFLYLALKGRRL
ncbi:iron ABC transporter permease [Campylobacter sp. RM12327]|uniref:FecCD family ABC transporter permease n=1 Tax=Campylobacter sputorum TaxID=206 RepID=UPI000B77F018|nr:MULTISPECIES: iron ABC transporter permease [Campylobacter]ASM39409.1 heme ABC transporter ChuBCD, permease protein [Campylobacter sputorum]MBE7358257.1 iron ABC transporter permease [Campylobacter sp. RM11302]MBF6669549.1 iron ABC transporter permease [Campylobacter sp. RM12327]MBF6674258.1 iron ABC transporter permease [Campylobacter sp. RM13538]MBF6676042.1 iron ABC transporter permease [Campylobacter sp. RM12321]